MVRKTTAVAIIGVVLLRTAIRLIGCRCSRLALITVVALAVFATSRAISLHDFESLLGIELVGIEINRIVELGSRYNLVNQAMRLGLLRRHSVTGQQHAHRNFLRNHAWQYDHAAIQRHTPYASFWQTK